MLWKCQLVTAQLDGNSLIQSPSLSHWSGINCKHLFLKMHCLGPEWWFGLFCTEDGLSMCLRVFNSLSGISTVSINLCYSSTFQVIPASTGNLLYCKFNIFYNAIGGYLQVRFSHTVKVISESCTVVNIS